MHFFKELTVAAAFVGACLALNSCSKDDTSNGNPTGASRLEVRLTDAPGNYQEVNIDIKEAYIHTDGNAGANAAGWQQLPLLNPGVYNLLDFTNGQDTLLISANLPAGHISQIRFVLGDNNSVKLVGENALRPLDTPSAQHSGLKLKINAHLVANVTYKLLLDFDAAKSIVVTGNGDYKLKPVIRVITSAIAGGIDGTVLPLIANPSIFAVKASNGDTIAGAMTSSTGAFLIQGLPADTYNVHFDAADSQYDKVENGVVVTNNDITHMGTVQLP